MEGPESEYGDADCFDDESSYASSAESFDRKLAAGMFGPMAWDPLPPLGFKWTSGPLSEEEKDSKAIAFGSNDGRCRIAEDDSQMHSKHQHALMATSNSKPRVTETVQGDSNKGTKKAASSNVGHAIAKLLTDKARQAGIGAAPGAPIHGFTRVKEAGAVNAVQNAWKKMAVAVDSGASESVMPTGEVKGYPVTMPEKPIWYANCNGGQMQNEGEQSVPMMLPSGEWCEMPFQQTSVTKPLASVVKMCESGTAVLFLPEQFGASIMINMLSGEFEVEELREEDGNYMLDVWIPPMEEVQSATRTAVGDNNSGFVRPQ